MGFFSKLFRNSQQTSVKLKNRSLIIHRTKEGSRKHEVEFLLIVHKYSPLRHGCSLWYLWGGNHIFKSAFPLFFNMIYLYPSKFQLYFMQLIWMWWIQLVNCLIDLSALIFHRDCQVHVSILPGPDNLYYCYKGMTRVLLHSYIWTHFPRALACSCICCGHDDARES